MNTPIATSINFVELFSQSGMVGKSVLLLLVAASLICWAVIFTKWRTLSRASKENKKFLDSFWAGKSLDEIFIRSETATAAPVANVFRSGYKELKKLGTPSNEGSGEEVDNIGRALSRSGQSEVSLLEKFLPMLATTAAAAPFIGLFGTVWGIMDSFHNIGATGSASLAVVAPGISEALIATAAGLFAAIPAVIFYNYFLNQIKKITIDIDCFSQDFLNLVQRSFMMGRKK